MMTLIDINMTIGKLWLESKNFVVLGRTLGKQVISDEEEVPQHQRPTTSARR